MNFQQSFRDPKFAHLCRHFKFHKQVSRPFEKVRNIGQIVMLQQVASGRPLKDRKSLCVMNTHLYFHPDAPHIRTVHAAMLMEEAEAMCASYMQSTGSDNNNASADDDADYVSHPAMLFAGDLNSSPCTGVIEYLTNGELSEYHHEWKRSLEFYWYNSKAVFANDESTEVVQTRGNTRSKLISSANSVRTNVGTSFGPNIKHKSIFKSVLGDPSPELPVTNYTAGTLIL